MAGRGPIPMSPALSIKRASPAPPLRLRPPHDHVDDRDLHVLLRWRRQLNVNHGAPVLRPRCGQSHREGFRLWIPCTLAPRFWRRGAPGVPRVRCL